MHQNLSPMDRDVRIAIVAPIALLVALGAVATVGGVIAFAIGVYAIVTAITGIDPAYTLYRRTTAQHA